MMDAIRQDRAPSYFFLHYEIISPHPDPLPTGEGNLVPTRRKSGTHPVHHATAKISPSPWGEGRDEGEQLWLVRNLLLVPHFAFPPSAIIKCPPLSPTARRAGWIGCNFDLRRIPIDARIEMVRTIKSPHPDPLSLGEGNLAPAGRKSGTHPIHHAAAKISPSPWGEGRDEGGLKTIIVPPSEVREQFQKIKPFANFSVEQRGWMLDVLNVVRKISQVGSSRCDDRTAQRAVPTKHFTNQDVYEFELHFKELHPHNPFIRDKIRQQLQDLARAGFLIHAGRNDYRLK